MTSTPRLCLVGPFIGRRRGQLLTQATVLADLFEAADYRVLAVSDSPNRWVRFVDIMLALARARRRIDLVVLGVYGRRSFVVEDAVSATVKRFGLPLVLSLHGGSLPVHFGRYPGWSARVLRRADALVAPSAFLARSAAALGFDVQVIPNVVDLTALPYRHRPDVQPRLLWMRSFYSHYNPHMAIDVLARLRAGAHDARLVMAGRNKGLQGTIEQLVDARGMADAVRFPGVLDQAGKSREGAWADIFINTNRIDNTPVAVIEACAMGLPVVSTDVGGVRDLLTHEDTALLVRDGDADAMARAIERLIRDRELAARLSRNGRALAERCAWPRVRAAWETLFATMAA